MELLKNTSVILPYFFPLFVPLFLLPFFLHILLSPFQRSLGTRLDDKGPNLSILIRNRLQESERIKFRVNHKYTSYPPPGS